MDDNILVIGIAGGTGSGKTTLMNNLISRFEGMVTVISHDNYYKRHDDMTYEERSQLNYDEPAAFDTSLMVYHLEELRRGHAIECPVYDFTIHNRSEQTIHIVPKKVIIRLRHQPDGLSSGRAAPGTRHRMPGVRLHHP